MLAYPPDLGWGRPSGPNMFTNYVRRSEPLLAPDRPTPTVYRSARPSIMKTPFPLFCALVVGGFAFPSNWAFAREPMHFASKEAPRDDCRGDSERRLYFARDIVIQPVKTMVVF